MTINRRGALRAITLGAARAAAGAEALEIRVGAVSARTARITIGAPGAAVRLDGALLPEIAKATGDRIATGARRTVKAGELEVEMDPESLRFAVRYAGAVVQQFELDRATGG
jgi:hypothetical protein